MCWTLGYENAPWFFLDSHSFRPRQPLDKGAFSLAAGEAFAFEVAVFDYPAGDERAIDGAIRWVYGRFHQPPREGLPIHPAWDRRAIRKARAADGRKEESPV